MNLIIKLLSVCLLLQFSFSSAINAQTGDVPIKDIRRISKEFLAQSTTSFKVTLLSEDDKEWPDHHTMAWDNVVNLPWTSAGIKVNVSNTHLKIKAPARFFQQLNRDQLRGEESVEGIVILITGLSPKQDHKVRVLSRLKKMIIVQRTTVSDADSNQAIWEVVMRFQ